MELITDFTESQLVEFWQYLLPARDDLVTEDGEPFRIVYPGRINDDAGADLRDAVIRTSRGLIKGDVEFHVRSSGWRAHRHHQSPVYNSVILHVVFWRDDERATSLANGGQVPILALHKYVSLDGQSNDPLRLRCGLPMGCQRTVERLGESVVGEFLDNAGWERFLAKTAEFETGIREAGACQSLYQGMMGALGYKKNKTAFLKLASRTPLQLLESEAWRGVSDEEYLRQQQARLLGNAGLLPSQRSDWRGAKGDGWIDDLEKTWATCSQAASMVADEWHFFKVRPSNFPTRRIAAMSYLLLRYRDRGVLSGVIDTVTRSSEGGSYRHLESALLVNTGGYWARYLDFGLPSRIIVPTLLGKSRVADIIVNILLPFAFAWSRHNSQPALGRGAVDLYRCYPRLPVNTLEKHMCRQMRLTTDVVSSARRQQGLLHVYNTLCSQGKCEGCALSRSREAA